ncbi:MAG: DUF4823 domain-containing protein, partial [Elusimicrobiota bacterium]|jgi:hypothetical protein|nr:DUF4823 domain-containing protein [Elusimicrobiota bacterium]
LICGCTFVGTRKEHIKFEQDKKIDTSSSFYLILPEDGHEISYFKENRVENKGSGKEAADVFFKKFYKNFGSLVMSKNNITISKGLEEAKIRGDKYMITLDVIEWNDEFYMTCIPAKPNTVQAQKTDSVDVSIQVYEVATGELLNKQRLQNAGCPTIFFGVIPIGTMGPKGRFNSSLNNWAKNIK